MDYQEAIDYFEGRMKLKEKEVQSENPDIKRADDKLMDIYKTAISAIQELQEYKKIGTLEEVQEAVEKQKAISREVIEGKYFCPKCHNLMPYPGYCGCGQKLY